jgi:hypothetical protein
MQNNQGHVFAFMEKPRMAQILSCSCEQSPLVFIKEPDFPWLHGAVGRCSRRLDFRGPAPQRRHGGPHRDRAEKPCLLPLRLPPPRAFPPPHLAQVRRRRNPLNPTSSRIALITLFPSHHFPLPQSSGTAAQTLTLFPFGIHLAGAAPSRRGFSTSPSYRVADAGAVLRDAADAAAAPTAPASFPSEVAWIAQDSSLSVAAAQHLIDAVHSFTGLNWWGFNYGFVGFVSLTLWP